MLHNTAHATVFSMHCVQRGDREREKFKWAQYKTNGENKPFQSETFHCLLLFQHFPSFILDG